ncbi:MAG: efflux transporter, RND family, MFP subunit [uncultured bacterium]|nr:MAG: efflux transporter, RND family, MFP subunit [uncultured bacterium]
MKLSNFKSPKVILIVVIIVISAYYFWKNKSHNSNQALQYKTTVAERSSLTTTVSSSGNVVVDQLATVDPTIIGTVSELAVNVGDSVKKGDRLFTIINEDLSVSNDKSKASLQQAENSIASAKLNVKQAKNDYEEAKDNEQSTSDQRRILKDKIVIAENGVIAAEKSYKANLADYRNQLSDGAKRTVTAPIDGSVSAINVKNGDDLSRLSSSSSSNSAPIIIGDLKTLKAKVAVNEVDIPNVSNGQKVIMTFGAIDGLTATGKVEKMDALGTLSSGVVTYDVTIGFDSIDSRIKPQMSVSAKIITDVKQNVVVVLNSALKIENNKTYLEILNERGQVEKRIIEIGVANNVETEIISGVEVGEKVVTQTIDPNKKTISTSNSNSSLRVPGLGGGMR